MLPPLKPCLALVLTLPILTFSASLSDVKASLAQNEPDTIEAEFVTSTAVMGQRLEAKGRLFSRGSAFFWMETETPLGRQRTVRNGSHTQITELSTG